MKAFSVLVAGLTLTLLTGCGTAPSSVQPARTATVTARAASGFADLQGRPASLAAFTGQPVVLCFLDPNQADSQAEIPLLLRLAGAYQADGVAFVAAGEHASADVLSQFAADSDLTFPLWQDRNGSELAGRHFASTPAFQFIRRDGSVANAHAGFASRGELLSGISAIL